MSTKWDIDEDRIDPDVKEKTGKLLKGRFNHEKITETLRRLGYDSIGEARTGYTVSKDGKIIYEVRSRSFKEVTDGYLNFINSIIYRKE